MTIGPTDADVAFLAERPRLEGLAYRLLGSRTDAEDTVSGAYLRWRGGDRAAIGNPAAFLTTVTTRLALDRLRRAARERQRYVGPWLPEPLPTDPAELPTPGSPDDAVLLAESLTYGFLAVLERLDPDERAAYLLREVYAEPYAVIAGAIGRSPAACRQVVHRARERVHGAPRFSLDRTRAEALAERLTAALLADDVDALGELLHEDVVLVSDGGAERRAARRPVVGRDRVGRLLASLARQVFAPGVDARTQVRWVNNQLAYAVWIDGELDSVMTIAVDGATETARAVHVIRNPDKLRSVEGTS